MHVSYVSILEIRPVIITHPSSVIITVSNENESLSLTCEAKGATTYYWERQDGSIPAGSTGQDNKTLTLVNVKPMDTGSYRCIVGNKCDNNFSDYATITVNGQLFYLNYVLKIGSFTCLNVITATSLYCSIVHA